MKEKEKEYLKENFKYPSGSILQMDFFTLERHLTDFAQKQTAEKDERIEELEKENERLKDHIEEETGLRSEQYKVYQSELNQYKEENERLKDVREYCEEWKDDLKLGFSARDILYILNKEE